MREFKFRVARIIYSSLKPEITPLYFLIKTQSVNTLYILQARFWTKSLSVRWAVEVDVDVSRFTELSVWIVAECNLHKISSFIFIQMPFTDWRWTIWLFPQSVKQSIYLFFLLLDFFYLGFYHWCVNLCRCSCVQTSEFIVKKKHKCFIFSLRWQLKVLSEWTNCIK